MTVRRHAGVAPSGRRPTDGRLRRGRAAPTRTWAPGEWPRRVRCPHLAGSLCPSRGRSVRPAHGALLLPHPVLAHRRASASAPSPRSTASTDAWSSRRRRGAHRSPSARAAPGPVTPPAPRLTQARTHGRRLSRTSGSRLRPPWTLGPPHGWPGTSGRLVRTSAMSAPDGVTLATAGTSAGARLRRAGPRHATPRATGRGTPWCRAPSARSSVRVTPVRPPPSPAW